MKMHPSILVALNECKTYEQLQQIQAQTITQQLLPNTYSFNTVIRSLPPLPSLILFSLLLRSRLKPDGHTFPFALKSSSPLRSPPITRSLHSLSLRLGFSLHPHVRNSLLHLYSLLHLLPDSLLIFHQQPLLSRDVVTYNALVSAHVRAGDMQSAHRLFSRMPVRDRVSWATLVSGYARFGPCERALQLFDEMLQRGLEPDGVAVVGALSACAQMGALDKGRAVHDYVKLHRRRVGLNAFVTTALVDMYGKCGCLEAAREVFASSTDKSVFSWNAMIMGLAMHGCGKQAIEQFSSMCDSGVGPDAITFLGLLVGCSHAGLVETARRLFHEMESVFGVKHTLGHYGCMVDLLARAGLIEEAVKMVEGMMPMEGDVYVWGGLLGGCRIHGNVEVAEVAARRIMEIDPDDGGTYSIMAHIYANAGRWEDVARVRKKMRARRRVRKNAGGSLIHVDGRTHQS